MHSKITIVQHLEEVEEMMGIGKLQIPMNMNMNKKHSNKKLFGDVHTSDLADPLAVATNKEETGTTDPLETIM